MKIHPRPLLLMCAAASTCLVGGQSWNLLALTPVTEVVVKTGDLAPDRDGKFELGLSGTTAVLNNCGWAAFRGSLSGATNGRDYGEFFADGTTRIQVARTGDPAPGGLSADFFRNFSNVPALNDGGQMLFEGTSELNNQKASCIFRSNHLTRLFDGLGQAAPGGNGTVFLFSLALERPAFNQKGVAAFVATLTGTSNTPNDDTAIYRTTKPGKLTEIAREGKAPPEGNGVFDQMLASNTTHPILNESGQVAFRAALRSTSGGNSDNQGMYRGDGKTLAMIARSGPTQTLPDGGTIHSFATPGQPDMNDSGEVVFPVDLDGDSSPEAIYKGLGGALTKIAREGDAIPNTSDIFGPFNGFPRINNAGQVVFNGLGAHINPSAQYWAIFRGDGNAANTKLVVKEGQAVPVGRSGIFQSLSPSGTLNQGDSGFCLNSSGQVAFRAGINVDVTVNETGIYLFDPTQPQPLQEVARTNNNFLGSTISSLQFAGTNGSTSGGGNAAAERSGLNDAGQVAFAFMLADGRNGISIWSPTLKLLCAYARKTQGTKTFDFELPLTGKLGVECRSASFASGGAQDNFSLLLRFTNKLSSVGSASVTTGVGSVSGAPTINGNTMTVQLTGVANAQKIIVTLSNVTDKAGRTLASTKVPMGILFGDIDGNRTVENKDVNAVSGKVGAKLRRNFRDDVDVDGSITQQDVTATQNHVGTGF